MTSHNGNFNEGGCCYSSVTCGCEKFKLKPEKSLMLQRLSGTTGEKLVEMKEPKPIEPLGKPEEPKIPEDDFDDDEIIDNLNPPLQPNEPEKKETKMEKFF